MKRFIIVSFKLIIFVMFLLTFCLYCYSFNQKSKYSDRYNYLKDDCIYIKTNYALYDSLVKKLNIEGCFYSFNNQNSNGIEVYVDSNNFAKFGLPLLNTYTVFEHVSVKISNDNLNKYSTKDGTLKINYTQFHLNTIELQEIVNKDILITIDENYDFNNGFMIINIKNISKDKLESLLNESSSLRGDIITYSNLLYNSGKQIKDRFNTEISTYNLIYLFVSIIPVMLCSIICFALKSIIDNNSIKDKFIMRIFGISNFRLYMRCWISIFIDVLFPALCALALSYFFISKNIEYKYILFFIGVIFLLSFLLNFIFYFKVKSLKISFIR